MLNNNSSLSRSYIQHSMLYRCFALIALLLCAGCTTLDGPPNPDDPYESFNRTMFEFNDQVDKYAFKPAAKGYNYVMPDFASKGVSNFFNNLDDIVVFVNQLFQFKLQKALATSARFVFNSTFGLFGLIDVATHMDLPKQNEDFGQTLAVWGVPSGPYVVLPLIGPRNIRDSAGLFVDWTYFDPVLNRQTTRQSLLTLTVKYIDVRAGLLKASNVLEDTVPDRYAFVRDAWLSRREFLIYDGNPPQEFSDEDLFKDENLFEDEKLFDDKGLNEEGALHKNAMENNLGITVKKGPTRKTDATEKIDKDKEDAVIDEPDNQ